MEKPPGPSHAKTYSGEPSKLTNPCGVPLPWWVGLAPSSQGSQAHQLREPQLVSGVRVSLC